jgi:phage gpG-like protein
MGSIKNIREVQKALADLGRRGQRTAKETSKILGRDAQLIARAHLTAKSHPPGTKTPSAPGEPPAMVTGRLARKVRIAPVVRASTGDGFYLVRVGPWGVAYSRIQEAGGMAGAGHRSRLPARPYMAPTLRELGRFAGPAVLRAWETTS